MHKTINSYRIESNRLKSVDYAFPNWFFVTICTENHKSFFGNIKSGNMNYSSIGEIVKEEWWLTNVVRKNVDLDEFVIMPNHIHGIVIINSGGKSDFVGSGLPKMTQRVISTDTHVTLKANSLGAIIGQFKSVCTKRIHSLYHNDFKWQPNYYEHIIRGQKDLERIRNYILQNPSKWEKDKFYMNTI
ncbi:MAG: transposase [Ignavibacteriales bacterium CG18_big_fil_WC_8_21_14_2_50_31_20]|nr:MAG: transposase [Ignavibacteriales bacterium CG18_big_fil_WC_8_21_14_2_50_31_20]